MLAMQARSFNNYFYLQSNNVNHPARFIGNKVTGILFENKVDYASTYRPNPLHSSFTTPSLLISLHFPILLPINPPT